LHQIQAEENFLADKDKILVVEDEEDTRYILDRLLTKNDFEVKTAVNGEEALKILPDFIPKVIIADWTMPLIDGIELCNIIKKNVNYKLIY
jgi:CheY-like chemotaxis protein